MVLIASVLALSFVSGPAPQAPGKPGLGPPIGGPWNHRVLSATSSDGLAWTRDPGVRLEHASVPCAVAAGERIFLYYVDADRGPGQPESVGCAVSTDGLRFEKQPFAIEGMPAKKAIDPCVLRDRDGTFRLYYFASSAPGDPAAEKGEHEIHLAISDDGIRFRNVGPAFRHPRLVDPDVFLFKGTWFMYVFGGGETVIATSTDGRSFTYKQPLALPGWGTVKPVELGDGRLRLYAFEQRRRAGNRVHSFLSTDGIEWTEETGDRLVAGQDEQITDPFVIPWRGGYKMFLKAEERATVERAGERPAGTPGLPPSGVPGRPSPGMPGPWDADVIVFRVSRDGQVGKAATFPRAGVPTIARIKDGRLIAAHQHFPEDDDAGFDKVAVRFSSDEGRTWSDPQVIRLAGLPEGMRFPFDPTLVPLPDGRIRLYFTSLRGRRFEEDLPAIHSAISADGVDYQFEPGIRFGIEGRPVIDCAVVLHQGVFHVYAPDNGPQRRPGPRPGEGPAGARPLPGEGPAPPPGIGYHATSPDGLRFTRVQDVWIEGRRRWLGNAQSYGEEIAFFGTGDPGPPAGPGVERPRGGVWMAVSRDGQSWRLLEDRSFPGADPGAVRTTDGGWVIVSTGPPRPGTPSARRPRPGERPPVERPPAEPQPRPGPAPFGMPGGDGPWNHRILLASSKDGLTWQVAGQVLAERASVPELFLGPDGRPILLFVDASGLSERGALGAMVQQADGAWSRRSTNLRGADPNVVRLDDGTYRAYTKGRDGSIQVFSSADGMDWRGLGEAFRDERYPHATDPDVFVTPSGWVMLISLGPRLLRCSSPDGLSFTAGESIDLGGSVSDTVAVEGGWRTFFHVNANPRTGAKMIIRSAFTADGRSWRVEDGDRVRAPEEGPARLGVADPASIRMPDGSWLMALKSFIEAPSRP